MMVVGAKIEGI